MCGIGGIISIGKINPNIAVKLKSMGQRIKHRGPDDEGFVLFGKEKADVFFSNDSAENLNGFTYSPKNHIDEAETFFFGGFLHRRLSILDLSAAGHQPMCNSDQSIWITYNGEIYNYLELKEQLRLKGHQFQTRTDTEVIIKAYEEWGTDCVTHFNGMFSFVLFDQNKNSLFAARDRFGVKPFYYYFQDKLFVFCSEQKGIRFLSEVKTGINEKAVYDFLICDEIEKEAEGMFKNILELQASTYLTLNLNNGELAINSYYKLQVNESTERFDERKAKNYIREVKELFLNAVKLRTRSDVEVGSCLSGGIDSSSIVKALQTNYLKSNSKLNLYTAVFPGEKIDESSFANKIVQTCPSVWHRVEVNSSDLLSSIGELVYAQDLPLWSSSTFAQHSVMKCVRESGIKVVLDGQGGDELFAGYFPYFIPFWKEVFKSEGIGGLKREWNAFTGIPSSAGYFAKESIKKIMHGLEVSKFIKNKSIGYLNPNFRNEFSNRKTVQKNSNTLNLRLAEEFQNDRLKVYLKCEDRCAMWHSVESRTPFADDLPLIEKVFSIPGIYKIHNGKSKFLLRECMKDFLPETIYNRKDKMGYVTPHNKWLSQIAMSVESHLDGDLKYFIDEKKLKKDLNHLSLNFNQSSRNTNENTVIFKIITLGIWKRKFNF